MSIRFATLAKAVAHSTYKPNEDVWIGGDAELGDWASGYYVFNRGSTADPGPNVIAVPNGRLERTSDTGAQLDALAEKTAEQIRPDLAEIDQRLLTLEEGLGTIATAINAMATNLPGAIATQLTNDNGEVPVSLPPQVLPADVVLWDSVGGLVLQDGRSLSSVIGLPVSVRRVAETASKFFSMRARMLQRPSGTPNYCLFVGDSTFAGMFSMGPVFTNARQNSLVVQIAAGLSRRGLPAQHESWCGGRTYSDPPAQASDYDPRVAVGAGWAANFGSLGTVRLANTTTTNPISLTPEQPFDRFDVLYAQSGGQGTFSANVDGGATIATVNASAASALGKHTFSCPLGLHTINIARLTAGVSIIAIIPWVSTSRDMLLLNSAAGSSTTAMHSETNLAWAAPGTGTYLQQRLTVISLGINDLIQNVPAATMRANLRALVAGVSISGPVLLVTPVPVLEVYNAYSTAARQAEQEQIYRDLAEEFNCRVVSTADVFGRNVPASIAAGTIDSDGVHPTPLGLGIWAQHIISAILA